MEIIYPLKTQKELRREGNIRFWKDRIKTIKERSEKEINEYKKWLKEPKIKLREVKK